MERSTRHRPPPAAHRARPGTGQSESEACGSDAWAVRAPRLRYTKMLEFGTAHRTKRSVIDSGYDCCDGQKLLNGMRGTDQAALSRHAQHQQAVDAAAPRVEGSVDRFTFRSRPASLSCKQNPACTGFCRRLSPPSLVFAIGRTLSPWPSNVESSSLSNIP